MLETKKNKGMHEVDNSSFPRITGTVSERDLPA